MYTTREEAGNRLRESLVSYDGAPVLVTDIGGTDGDGVTAYIDSWPFTRRNLVEVSVNDPGFDGFSPLPLGFANYFERGNLQTLWCERIPARRMQQGLVNANFRARSLLDRGGYGLEDIRSSDAFVEMVRGEYGSVEEVRQLLVPYSAIAVAREYALALDGSGYTTIYHQTDPLGLLLGDTVYLRPDRQYAREQIIESGLFGSNIQNL